MDRGKMTAAAEAILFAIGGAVRSQKLEAALETDAFTVADIIEELNAKYNSPEHGITIIQIGDSYQMCTKKEEYEALIKVVALPKQFRLTDVQLETLSIIAYKQPITKAEIDKIRGVQSDHAVNRLIEADLVEEKGRLNMPGRPILLGTTEEFLRRFGLKSIDELPRIAEEKLDAFRHEAEDELGYVPGEPEDYEMPEQMSFMDENGIIRIGI